MNHKAFKLSTFIPAALAVLCIAANVVFTQAASYGRTTLREMTQNAVAVAEVTVLKRTYPAMKPNEFPRTHIEVTVNKTFKGSLPQTLTLDLPGAVHGANVYAVPDSANFELNERAIVFIKEPKAGQFMVQDLGLGKFNLVNRNNQTFVESPLCPKAMPNQKDDMEASLLTKSIPYNDFCKLISAYATNEEPQVSPLKMAMLLKNDAHTCPINQVCAHNNILEIEALKNVSAATQTRQWINFSMIAAFLLVCAAVAVALRRRNALKTVSVKTNALLLAAILTGGALIGGNFTSAYTASGTVWNLNDTQNPNKISNGKVVWKQSNQVSKTNAACFTDVDASFAKWGSITGCRLGFINAGATANTKNSPSDNMNVIAWEPAPGSDFSQNTLGITYSFFTVGGTSYYTDSDIIFNDRDFGWGQGGNGNVKSVSLHEIGHMIGLNHTNTNSAVMNPFDGGLTNLSNDEINGAIALYPGTNTGTPTTPPAPTTPPDTATAPTANASGSPLSGPAPLNSFFDASATVQGTNPIATYSWNFGDGNTGSGKTLNHTFSVAGVYTVTLTVTDTQGLTSTVTLNVNATGNVNGGGNGGSSVEENATLVKATFKLIFVTSGRDTFTATIYSENAAAFTMGRSRDNSRTDGVLKIGSAKFNFSFDAFSRKGFGEGFSSIKINPKNGLVSISVKAANLQEALEMHGARNENNFGETVEVPVSVIFGNGSELSIHTKGNFQYKAIEGKVGAGKY